MSSRVRKVAVVAGLVALGVTETREALAEDPGSGPSVSQGGGSQGGGRTNAKKAPPKARPRDAGLVATLPGFQMLPDGSSRLFVTLTGQANVTEKKDARALTYVIHGAHVVLRNNENALVTVHFNTPVTRARLLPVRGDLAFSIELRADSASTWRMVDGGDGSAILQVDFPKGTFLPPGEMDPSGAVASDPNVDPRLPRPPEADAPPSGGAHHGGRRRGSAPPPAPPTPPAPPGPPDTPTPGT
jgi:hypothetical protein